MSHFRIESALLIFWKSAIFNHLPRVQEAYLFFDSIFVSNRGIAIPFFINFFQIQFPELQGFNIQGGLSISPEFAAVLLSLVIYTASFIAEIVRAGIHSISKGQVEASYALGLSPIKTLRLIVLPQAMRVITPPLISQYLNLIKNSSLDVYIGYPDLFAVSGTIFNQTGRAVEMVFLLMITFLSLSLLTSWILNRYNRHIQLVGR